MKNDKVKIPLKWYSDLIRIPGTENEFVLLEWFEEEDCINKTLWCLGAYMRIRYYKINQVLVDTRTNRELTLLITDNAISPNLFDKSTLYYEQIGESVGKNHDVPIAYDDAKKFKLFEEDNI